MVPEQQEQDYPETEGREVARTPEQTEEPDRPSREAARYRTQLRGVEAERDALAARVEELTRRAVERELPAHVTAAALWSTTDLADLVVEDDGTIDPDRLAEAITATEESYQLRPRVGPYGSTNGNRDATKYGGGSSSIAQALRGGR